MLMFKSFALQLLEEPIGNTIGFSIYSQRPHLLHRDEPLVINWIFYMTVGQRLNIFGLIA